MESKINLLAFSLIEKLYVKSKESNTQKEPPELTGSIKERGFVDMSSKINGLGIQRTVSGENILTSISFLEENSEIGLEGESFHEFQSLISDILLLPEIRTKISQAYIEDTTFRWIYEVKQKGIAQQSVLDYIKLSLDDKVKDFEFYFPINNLIIERPFTVGNIEFIYFTKKDMDDFFQLCQSTLTPTTAEDFDDLYRNEYQGTVVAKSSINAEWYYGRDIAKKNAELAVDVLKIIALAPSLLHQPSPFELNHRLNYQLRSSFLSKEKNDTKSGYSISLDFQSAKQFTFTNTIINASNLNGLNAFSTFITLNNDNELYRLIIDAIEMYSFALSINDMHRRAIALITILESLLLEDDRLKDMEKKAKTRLSKVLPGTANEKEQIKDLFSKIYQIRHKMVHKAIRRPINITELRKAQLQLMLLLLNLTHLNVSESINDKISLFTKLDSQIV